MSYKIRQLPNLRFSYSFISCFKTLDLPSVKGKLERFLFRMNSLNGEYVEKLLEENRLVYQLDGYYIFQVHFKKQYYLLLFKGNQIVTLFRNNRQELTKEDWQRVQEVLLQEGWE